MMHSEKNQRDTDHIVHYRNLSILLGAKPEQMLGDFDRDLCRNWDPKVTGPLSLEDMDQTELFEENDKIRADERRKIISMIESVK